MGTVHQHVNYLKQEINISICGISLSENTNKAHLLQGGGWLSALMVPMLNTMKPNWNVAWTWSPLYPRLVLQDCGHPWWPGVVPWNVGKKTLVSPTVSSDVVKWDMSQIHSLNPSPKSTLCSILQIKTVPAMIIIHCSSPWLWAPRRAEEVASTPISISINLSKAYVTFTPHDNCTYHVVVGRK